MFQPRRNPNPFTQPFAYTRIGGFSPTGITGLTLWLDAVQITGAVNGGALAQWDDASGGGRHVTQATAANQPTYQTSVRNGLPVVRFDGTNDRLARVGMTGIDAARQLVAVVAASTNSGGERHMFNARQTSGAATIIRQQLSTHRAQLRGVQVAASTGGTAWAVHIVHNDAGSVTYRRNGTLEGTTTATLSVNTAPTDMYVGNEITANFWVGDIAEIVWYTSASDFAAGDITALETYLRNKWAI